MSDTRGGPRPTAGWQPQGVGQPAVLVSRSDPTRGGTGGPRWMWPAAIAAVTVLGLAAAAVWQWSAGDSGGSSPPTDGYLVAGWLPDGFGPDIAIEEPGHTVEHDRVAREIVVYGDTRSGDGWDSPLISVSLATASDPSQWEELGQPDEADRETVPVGGRTWDVSRSTLGMDEAILAMNVSGTMWLGVIGVAIEREDLLAVLPHVIDTPAVNRDGLPEGFEELARGPSRLAFPMRFDGTTVDGLFLGYGADEPGIWMQQVPDVDERAVPLLRLEELLTSEDSDLDHRDLEVRGQPAVVRRAPVEAPSGPMPIRHSPFAGASGRASLPDHLTIVQWFEPEIGRTVQVGSAMIDEGSLLRFIEGLRVAEQGEVEALLDDPGVPPEYGTGRWGFDDDLA